MLIYNEESGTEKRLIDILDEELRDRNRSVRGNRVKPVEEEDENGIEKVLAYYGMLEKCLDDTYKNIRPRTKTTDRIGKMYKNGLREMLISGKTDIVEILDLDSMYEKLSDLPEGSFAEVVEEDEDIVSITSSVEEEDLLEDFRGDMGQTDGNAEDIEIIDLTEDFVEELEGDVTFLLDAEDFTQEEEDMLGQDENFTDEGALFEMEDSEEMIDNSANIGKYRNKGMFFPNSEETIVLKDMEDFDRLFGDRIKAGKSKVAYPRDNLETVPEEGNTSMRVENTASVKSNEDMQKKGVKNVKEKKEQNVDNYMECYTCSYKKDSKKFKKARRAIKEAIAEINICIAEESATAVKLKKYLKAIKVLMFVMVTVGMIFVFMMIFNLLNIYATTLLNI